MPHLKQYNYIYIFIIFAHLIQEPRDSQGRELLNEAVISLYMDGARGEYYENL